MKYPYPYGGTTGTVAKVREGNSCTLRFVLDDEGDAIPNSAVTAATYSLYDHATHEVINNLHNIDVSASISALGVVTVNLHEDDNIIVGDPDQAEELHVLVFEATANAAPNQLSVREEIGIIVQNLPFYERHTEGGTVYKTVRLMWRTL